MSTSASLGQSKVPASWALLRTDLAHRVPAAREPKAPSSASRSRPAGRMYSSQRGHHGPLHTSEGRHSGSRASRATLAIRPLATWRLPSLGIALRCEKTARNYGSFVALACAFILIKSVHTALVSQGQAIPDAIRQYRADRGDILSLAPRSRWAEEKRGQTPARAQSRKTKNPRGYRGSRQFPSTEVQRGSATLRGIISPRKVRW